MKSHPLTSLVVIESKRYASLSRCRKRWLKTHGMVLFFFVCGMTSQAQESTPTSTQPVRVWLTPAANAASENSWYPPTIEIVQGNLTRFDHHGLLLQKEGDLAESAYASTRVLWIELTTVGKSSQRILEKYVAGDFAEAFASLPAALESRPSVWRQQQLTMIAANAGCRSGRGNISLELVSQLDRRPLPAMVLGWAPIAWAGYPFESAHRDFGKDAAWVVDAKTHLGGDSPLEKLVAASWLLSTPDRAEAIKQIKMLIKKKDRPSIAALAYCVLWTTATPPQVKSNQSKWLRQLEQLPMALQMGPMFALERKLEAAGEGELSGLLTSSIQLTPIAPHPLLIDRNRSND